MKKFLILIGLGWCSVQLFAVKFDSKPYLQNVQSNEATVMWLCSDNVGMYGWVEYIAKGGTRQKAYQIVDGVRAFNNHINQVRLANLQPGTQYSYRVYNVALTQVNRTSLKSGDTIVSDIYTFTTPAVDAPTVKCRIFNDIHTNPTVFTKLMGYSMVNDYDFVFFTGDILNIVEDENAILTNLLRPCINLFATQKPFFTVKGNHENNREYVRHYWEYFANSSSATGRTLGYYSFSWGPCFFIVLDSGSDIDDSTGFLASLQHFDSYREEQAVWLEKELQSEAKKKAAFTFVMMHAPTYSNTTKEYHQSTHSRELFQPLFHKYGIDALICGHTHIPAIMEADEDTHHYPIVIGGGNTTDAGARDMPTLTTLEATRYNAIFTIYDYDGALLYRLDLASKNLPALTGDLMLARVGDGTTALNRANAYPVFLDEYNLNKRTATKVTTTALPTTTSGSNHRCVAIGSSLTSSYLNLSADGHYMLFGGYDDAVGEKSATKAADVAPRVVAVVDAKGNVNTTTAIKNAYSAQEFRCVASTDGKTLYLSGAGTTDNPGGVYTATIGDTLATRLSVSDAESRAIHYYDDLWVNNGTNILQAGTSVLPAGPTISASADFTIVDMNDSGTEKVLYWIVGTNDIAKYSLVKGNWVYNGTYSNLLRPRALLARKSDDCIQVFAVNGINAAAGSCKLVVLEDAAGYNQPVCGLVSELLDLTGTYTTFRGLCWKPSPTTDVISPSASASSANARVILLPDGRICIQRDNQLYSLTGIKIQ